MAGDGVSPDLITTKATKTLRTAEGPLGATLADFYTSSMVVLWSFDRCGM